MSSKQRVITVGPGPFVMVDDSDSDILIAKQCFMESRLENEFLSFASGEAFLKHMHAVMDGSASMPGVVMLDINMPRMNGFEVLSAIRAFREFEELPVIMMLTNSDNPRDIEESSKLGADGFATKPSSLDEYVAFFNSLSTGSTTRSAEVTGESVR